jgi:hypothetical protein
VERERGGEGRKRQIKQKLVLRIEQEPPPTTNQILCITSTVYERQDHIQLILMQFGHLLVESAADLLVQVWIVMGAFHCHQK